MIQHWYTLPLVVAVAIVGLWMAYKLGRFVLRVASGLVLLGLIGLVIWYLFLR